MFGIYALELGHRKKDVAIIACLILSPHKEEMFFYPKKPHPKIIFQRRLLLPPIPFSLPSSSYNAQATLKTSRFSGIDYLRVIACFMVILLHTAAINFPSFVERWEIYVFYDAFCRCSVPLFFMISGYLLLSRNHDSVDLKKFITKRFSRIFIPFCILVILYALIKGWSFSETVSRAINQKVEFHLWYVYSIIGIYFFLPIFLPLFSEKNIKIVKYYLVMWTVIQEFTSMANSFLTHKILIFNNFNFYYFFGA